MAKRSYFKEIESLESTWADIWSSNTVFPSNITKDWLQGTAFCVGSGGSLSLAKLWQCVHEKYGLGTAKAITPYELNYTPSKPDIVVLISASGKNHDVLQAFKDAIQRQARVLIFTSSRKSPLIGLSRKHQESAAVICPSIQIAKDGFLAVNSVIAIACLMAKVTKKLFQENSFTESPVKKAIEHHSADIKNIKAVYNGTVQIISSEWGTPAGLDLEARMAESAIGTCFHTDPRNFGHGRFLWLEKHPSSTIVFFDTIASARYITKYKKLLPEHVPCHSIDAPYENISGSIYCLARSILLFGEFAKRKKVDPGKPSVPKWGRKLHRLYLGKQDLPSNYLSTDGDGQFNKYPALYKTFSALVLDIDGTLLDTDGRFDPIRNDMCNELERLLDSGLKIGFATGRGMSAVELLRKQIPKRFHNKIIIGLHNGVSVGRLSENVEAKCSYNWPLRGYLLKIIDGIKGKSKIKISEGQAQISIRGMSLLQRKKLISEMHSKLGSAALFIKYVTSGHSLDILPAWTSKLLVVEALIKLNDENVLCIGDQGQFGGNDEELLTWQPSISVGKERPASDDCLWIGKKRSYYESSGALFVLKSIIKENNAFRFDMSKIG